MSVDINEISFDNKKTAKYLLTVALVIEVSVAILAIFMGYTVARGGTIGVATDYQLPALLLTLNWVVTFGLFILIAIVELTRVPLVLSIYRGESSLWRIIGTIFLLIIMLLAFETLYLAQLQRNTLSLQNINTLDYDINESRDRILNFEKDIIGSFLGYMPNFIGFCR